MMVNDDGDSDGDHSDGMRNEDAKKQTGERTFEFAKTTIHQQSQREKGCLPGPMGWWATWLIPCHGVNASAVVMQGENEGSFELSKILHRSFKKQKTFDRQREAGQPY